jgi:hypothetical protein
MKRRGKQHKKDARVAVNSSIKAAPSPFVDPPVKREPLRASLGSALITGVAAVTGSAAIGISGAELR